MRIALFTETFLPHVDGVVTRLTHTIAELRRMGDEVLVVAPNAATLPAEYQGAQVIGTPSLPLPMYRDMRFGVPFPVDVTREALAAFAPDLIHAVNPVMVGLGALYYARKHGVPLVASYHTNMPAYARRYLLGAFEGVTWRYLRLIHNCALLNLCTSRPVREMLRARGFRHVELWEPGVDAALFRPERRADVWRSRLTGGSPDATILLYAGRLATEKNLERLIPALLLLPGCHLAFVGDGPAAGVLKRVFAGLPVMFLGPLYDEELAAAYAAADVFVLPSSTETLGLAAIEAMAAGVPVVGARRGGIPDIVIEGETGVLFDPDIPDDLFKKLAPLVASAAERARMGLAARQRAAGWSWSATTAHLRARYLCLLQRNATLSDTPLAPSALH